MTQKNKNKNFAILASGSGSNAENLVRTAQELGAKISCLICDRPGAGVLNRCDKLGVKTCVIKKSGSKERHEAEIIKELKAMEVNWLLLAGYMRILSPNFLANFYDEQKGRNQVVNIHPSLLPEYPGLNSYQRAFEDGVKTSGATTHFVDAGVDTGPIIEQEIFYREPGDDLAVFSARGLALEHKLYSRTLKRIIKDQA